MTRRWVMFVASAVQLLQLLRLATEPDMEMDAPPLPPDVQIHDAYHDPMRDVFVIVLESELFDPVEVTQKGDVWQGAWNEWVMEVPTPSHLSVPRGGAPPPDARWEAYFLPPERIIHLLQTIASKAAFHLPPLPPDVRLRAAHYDDERRAMVLFLESAFFEPARQVPTDGGVQITLPERWLNLNPTSEPGSPPPPS